MKRAVVAFRQDMRANGPVECYARSVVKYLQRNNVYVVTVGEGHDAERLDELHSDQYDFLLEIENGRNSKGVLPFQQADHRWNIPSAVMLIDSHGHPDLHKKISSAYDHVFFAVWSRRDLYVNHPSAHWAPCASDPQWFWYKDHEGKSKEFDFGFFGSKGGLDRADPMRLVCEKNGWSYDIRQVSKRGRHKWPQMAEAMAPCRHLFNHGQKHDGPNQRVLESMLMKRPLLTDSTDDMDGMAKIFTEGYHYIGYDSYTYADLEEKMQWVIDYPDAAARIAANGYSEAMENHTIGSRVKLILEVLDGS